MGPFVLNFKYFVFKFLFKIQKQIKKSNKKKQKIQGNKLDLKNKDTQYNKNMPLLH